MAHTKSFTLILSLLLFTFCLSEPAVDRNQCEQFIDKMIDGFTHFNQSEIPLPTVVYSGIMPGLVGQFKQCRDANFSYFLLSLQNNETFTNSYSSACLHKSCTTQDVENALAFIGPVAYDYQQSKPIDGLAITGIVLISLWLAALIGWSCFIYMKGEPEVKQPLIKTTQTYDRTSINSEPSQPRVEIVNSLETGFNFKEINFYKGYQQLFEPTDKKSIFSPLIFFATLSYLISLEFSYRQSISENQGKTAAQLLYSFGGIIGCNTEIALHTIMFIFGLRLAYGVYKITNVKGYLRYYFDQIIKKWLLLFLMSLLTYAYIITLTDEPLDKIWKLNTGEDCPGYMWQVWFLFRYMVTDGKRCAPWLSVFASEIFFILISAPFVLIYRTSSKKLGYALFFLLILLSIFVSFAILDGHNIVYQPAKLLNGDIKYALIYQPNTFVRMGAYFFGLAFGLFLIEGLQKTQNSGELQSKIATNVRRSPLVQIVIQFLGFSSMMINYFLIAKYLSDSADKQPYGYLVFSPLFFIVGLALFVLPSFWQGESKFTKLVNSIFGWRKWVHLDRISVTLLLAGPMVIATNVYGMQSTIFYDWNSLVFYTLGDITLAYIICLAVAAAFESQINKLNQLLQQKVYGNETKYSVLVLQ